MRLEEFYQENEKQKELRHMVEVLEEAFPKSSHFFKINTDHKRVEFWIDKTIVFSFKYLHNKESCYMYSVYSENHKLNKTNKIARDNCSSIDEAITQAKNAFYDQLNKWKSRIQKQ